MTYAILTNHADSSPSRRANITLWTIQAILAALFLFAGGMKLVMPIEMLTKNMPLPELFLRFIGVAEVLGALGLILPAAFRIHPELTSLAAVGLIVIMIGATGVTLASGGGVMVIVPVVVGILAAVVAYGRLQVAPYPEASFRLVVQTA